MLKKLIGKLRFKARHLKFKVMRFQDNRRRAIYRHNRRRSMIGSHDVHAAIEKLTNWQRSQWARAKYPRNAEQIEAFAAKKKPKKEKA